jgi:hypothetical protein
MRFSTNDVIVARSRLHLLNPCYSYSSLGIHGLGLLAQYPLLPSPVPKKNWGCASMTGEGTISKVVGAEAAAGWFTTALTAVCGRSAVKEKDLAVTSPVVKAIVIPPITAIQRSMRCPRTAGAYNLIMSIDSLHVWKCAHSILVLQVLGRV